MRFHHRHLPVSLLLGGLALSAGGQQAPEIPVFNETVDVNLVNIEVVVLHRGEPVSDLTIDDFEIFDDDRRVEITNFSASVDEAPSADQTPQTPRAAGDGKIDGRTGDGEAQQRGLVVVLVDDAHITRANRQLILAALKEKIRELAGETFMVIRKTQTLELVGPVTHDIEMVVAAIEKVSKMAGLGGLKEGSRAQLRMENELQSSSAMSRSGDQAEMAFRGELETQEEQMLVRNGSQVMAGFFKGLADTPGRKALLWVNDRFLLDEDTREDILGLIAEAGASRVVVYPFAGDANSLANARGAGFSTDSAGAAMRSELAGLDLIANETGGRVAQSIGSIGDNLQAMRRDMNSYYSLGYLTPHGGDGRSHNIRVRVLRPDTTLRYQTSYVDKSPELRIIDTLFAALLIDAAPDELGVKVSLGEITQQKKKLFNVPIDLIIPLQPLALVTQGSERVGQLSIYTMVVGGKERGEPTKLTQSVKVPMSVDVRGSAVAGGRMLSLKQGQHTIALVVRDDLSGKKTGVQIPVTID